MCFGKLICALGNCFVFWEIDLCFGKLFCVLVNRFVIDPFGPPYRVYEKEGEKIEKYHAQKREIGRLWCP